MHVQFPIEYYHVPENFRQPTSTSPLVVAEYFVSHVPD